MELQLGLELSLFPTKNVTSTTTSIPTKEFDLNTSGNVDPKDTFGSDSHLSSNYIFFNKKRSFYEAFADQDAVLNTVSYVPQTLPLFLRDDDNNNNHIINKDDLLEENSSSSYTISESDGYENGAIGWPPIKSCRKNLCGDRGSLSKSIYVKVKMEGVAIARKVDLSQHHSYQTLTTTLLGMFDKCQEDIKAYNLTYQDKEGDWLLSGDVPWGTFMKSVQCLKLIRKGGFDR